MLRQLAFLVLTAGVVVACDHTSPFAYTPPQDVGPQDSAYPRRLTFNLGDDRNPSVLGDTLVYSRLDLSHSKSDRCIAMLPVGGGTLIAQFCPPVARDTINAWWEPALSPDGSQIAYLWQRGSFQTAAPQSDTLVIASAADPTKVLHKWKLDSLDASLGVVLEYPAKLSWVNASTLRFLFSSFTIRYVQAGSYTRYADTTIASAGLVNMNVKTGRITAVRGAEAALTYATAADGGVWFTTLATQDTLLHLAPGATTPDTVGAFGRSPVDLANVDGAPVAIVFMPAIVDHFNIERLDPANGTMSVVSVGTEPLRRIAGAPGGRVVAERELYEILYGAPANLWLYRLP